MLRSPNYCFDFSRPGVPAARRGGRSSSRDVSAAAPCSERPASSAQDKSSPRPRPLGAARCPPAGTPRPGAGAGGRAGQPSRGPDKGRRAIDESRSGIASARGAVSGAAAPCPEFCFGQRPPHYTRTTPGPEPPLPRPPARLRSPAPEAAPLDKSRGDPARGLFRCRSRGRRHHDGLGERPRRGRDPRHQAVRQVEHGRRANQRHLLAGLHRGEGEVCQVPAPQRRAVRGQALPQGPVPHCGAAHQLHDDARAQQWQEADDRAHRQARLRDHPPAHWREPSAGLGERHHQ